MWVNADRYKQLVGKEAYRWHQEYKDRPKDKEYLKFKRKRMLEAWLGGLLYLTFCVVVLAIIVGIITGLGWLFATGILALQIIVVVIGIGIAAAVAGTMFA